MKPKDWAGGEIVWLLDVMAPSEKNATDVLKGFRHVAKKDEINIHPMVSRLVNAKELKKLARAPQAAIADSEKQPLH